MEIWMMKITINWHMDSGIIHCNPFILKKVTWNWHLILHHNDVMKWNAFCITGLWKRTPSSPVDSPIKGPEKRSLCDGLPWQARWFLCLNNCLTKSGVASDLNAITLIVVKLPISILFGQLDIINQSKLSPRWKYNFISDVLIRYKTHTHTNTNRYM